MIPAGAAFVYTGKRRKAGPALKFFRRGLKAVKHDKVPGYKRQFRLGYEPGSVEARVVENPAYIPAFPCEKKPRFPAQLP